MQNEGKPQYFCIEVLDHNFKTSGIHWQRGDFSVKAKYVKPNDLNFLLQVKCSETKDQPFRRMAVTSQFQVSEVPVYVVLVFWRLFQRLFGYFWPVGRILLPLIQKGQCSQSLYLWVSGDQAAAFFPFLSCQSADSWSVPVHAVTRHCLQGPCSPSSTGCCQLNPRMAHFIGCTSLSVSKGSKLLWAVTWVGLWQKQSSSLLFLFQTCMLCSWTSRRFLRKAATLAKWKHFPTAVSVVGSKPSVSAKWLTEVRVLLEEQSAVQ